MTQRGGLGRGLSALIPRGPGGVTEVDVARIHPNPHQPRLGMNELALQELANSIRQHGVLQPLIVSRAEDGYVLIAGERRWRAAQLAGLRTVPVLLRETTPSERMVLALVENLQRTDLSPLEQASAYRQLLDEYGLSHEELAERVGKSRTAVTNTLRLLNLPAEAQAALAEGRITEGHARALLGCDRREVLLQALETVVAQALSVRQTEELVRRLTAEPSAPPDAVPAARPPNDADTRALEERLCQVLGTKVLLRRGRRGGRLVIHFYSDEQLEGIIQAIAGLDG